MCVNSTARDGFNRGFSITIPGSATATRALPALNGNTVSAEALQAASLAALADLFAVVVPTVADIPDWMAGARRRFQCVNEISVDPVLTWYLERDSDSPLFSSGRAVLPRTLRYPASLWAGPDIHVRAFAGVRLILSSRGSGELGTSVTFRVVAPDPPLQARRLSSLGHGMFANAVRIGNKITETTTARPTISAYRKDFGSMSNLRHIFRLTP
jgi:hypothetical protein